MSAREICMRRVCLHVVYTFGTFSKYMYVCVYWSWSRYIQFGSIENSHVNIYIYTHLITAHGNENNLYDSKQTQHLSVS